MGDKSPKSSRKQAEQKKSKTDGDKQRKDDIEAAKRVESPKKDKPK